MAQVLPPVLQQSTSISLLHSPPDHFQPTPSSQTHSGSKRLSQMPRSHVYNGQNSMPSFRGSGAAPVAPYAFQSTPHLRQENRTISAPVGDVQQLGKANAGNRLGPSNASSISTNSTRSSSSSNSAPGHRLTSKDDFAIPIGSTKAYSPTARPMSTINLKSSSSPDLSLNLPPISFDSKETASARPAATRYRRNQSKSEIGKDGIASPPTSPAPESPSRSTLGSDRGKENVFVLPKLELTVNNDANPSHSRKASDDSIGRQGASEQAKRYRRRSAANLTGSTLTDSSGAPGSTPTFAAVASASLQAVAIDPRSSSIGRPAGNADQRPSSSVETKSAKAKEPEKTWAQVAARPPVEKPGSSNSVQQAQVRTSARPLTPRSSSGGRRPASPLRSAEASGQRAVKPSPLSKPVQQDDNAANQTGRAASALVPENVQASSPAAQQLQALSDKDYSKNMKSRLRRAFSFGSSAELRRASAQNNIERERSKLHKEPAQDDTMDAKLAAEVAAQEAAGLGNSIYSQGQVTGSTDNLSLASTASSASMMLRKMGKGMKKSARSVKGLFRPKSVIGVPAADEPVASLPSTAQVSMITVEAERERVNVNLHPNDRAQGETDFPHLERNSLDASSAADVASDFRSRKSIIGGDVEREEVLKAVRKGILKRTGTGTSSAASSPVSQAVDGDAISFQLPKLSASPLGSGPSTPIADDASATGVQKTQSLNIRNDYFSNSKTRSVSTMSLPNASATAARNIAWNPRIQFHDVWSPSEYDRRGDIATCNRLTPMLAQQIKEELNSFKMEMEVHELSKPHTHFF